MTRKPAPQHATITKWALQTYGLRVQALEPLDLGYDPTASIYRLETPDQSFFLKLRSSELNRVSLTVPHLLKRNGIGNVIAPLEARTGQLWSLLDDYSAVLYPFVEGDSAMRVGMSREQWLEFGQTLKQVHSPKIARQVSELVPRETFDIPSFAKVLEVEAALGRHGLEQPAQQKLAELWSEKHELIHQAGERAERLGQELRGQSLEFVLCHADIHAANIMVSGERIFLVDWDSPILAPIERDLLFVLESPIARPVQPQEERWFLEGYGRVEVNPAALAYFRYERAIQDIGEFAYSLLFDTGRGDRAMADDLRLFSAQFAPGEVLELAMANDPGS